MYCKIGPYKSWVGPYQIASVLRFVGVSADKQHRVGKLLSGTWVNSLCEWVESKRSRKVDIRIDPYDTWSMDSTLAVIILPMLKQLKRTKHGIPNSLGAPDSTTAHQLTFDFYTDEDPRIWEAAAQEWESVLDEMVWTFEQLQPDCDWENKYWTVLPELDLDDYPEDKDKTIVPVRWKVVGECDWEGMNAHNNRICRGLKLFGKHYRDLWD